MVSSRRPGILCLCYAIAVLSGAGLARGSEDDDIGEFSKVTIGSVRPLPDRSIRHRRTGTNLDRFGLEAGVFFVDGQWDLVHWLGAGSLGRGPTRLRAIVGSGVTAVRPRVLAGMRCARRRSRERR